MKNFLRKILPSSLKARIIYYLTTCNTKELNIYLRNSIAFQNLAEPSPLISDIFEHIKQMPGWFNIDDCAHFYLLLSLQSVLGVKGDLLEIGSYHGRSAALMSWCLREGEKIVICDAFESETQDEYVNKPSYHTLIKNIMKVNPELDKSRITVHECLSSELSLAENNRFRFVHIDGGHSENQVYADLSLCQNHLIDEGIISIDDYKNKHWPGVTIGTDKFLSENPEFFIFADLNRHGAIGRKLYLMKNQVAVINHQKRQDRLA